MADNAKYFHWDKTHLRSECCRLNDELEKLTTWIHVAEDLPAEETGVLAIIKPTAEQLERELENDMTPLVMAIDEDGVWYNWSTGRDLNTRWFTVTHWMKLPERIK